MRRTAALCLLPVLAACGGPGSPGPAGALAYGVPRDAPLVYVQGDTARIDIDAGGQRFSIRAASATTLSMDFDRTGEGMTVTATVTDLDSSIDNPMAGRQTVDESLVDGPLVFTLGPRGEVDLVSSPELSGAAREMVSPSNLAYHLFPRLPGTAVAPGQTWTDTLRYEAEEPSGEVSVTSILDYTVAGDTTVAGGRYLKVTFTGEDTRAVEGETQGMAFTQDVSGSVEGHFLWDQSAGVLHSLEQRGDYRGSMDVSAAPMPLDVRVRNTTRIGRQGA